MQRYNNDSKDLLLTRCESVIKTLQELLGQTQK
jgi:hypothetical protein